MNRFFPLVNQLSSYDRETLVSDLSAGLTVGVMLIPQGMAYALIAGLPPIFGLYASLVPLVIYALLGTSRQLAVGPVAMISLLVAAGVGPLAGGDELLYIRYALTLALMVGAIQFTLGVLRFGFLANFLSHPVLVGFTSAAALIIGFSQVKHLLGLNIPRSSFVHEIVVDVVSRIGEINPATLVVGLLAIVTLVLVRRVSPRAPGPLLVVALATIAVFLFGLDGKGVGIVGDVPGGLPVPQLPLLGIDVFGALMPTALTISLVGFMESYAVAKVYATKHRYDVDANRELVGLGLANVVGSFFLSYPTTGGFSRTAVNDQAGARTNVAAIFSAVIIAITLLFLTGLFFYLPKAVLAAIVMVAVAKLIDWREARFLWRVDRREFALMVLTFAATLMLGIEQGILVGVVASILVVLYQTSRPHTAVMGRLAGSENFRNILRNPDAATVDGVPVLRFDASLYFANAAYLKDTVEELTDPQTTRALVLDFYPVNRIDSTGLHALTELVESLGRRSIDVHFSGVKGPVLDRMAKSGLAQLVGDSNFHKNVAGAVREAGRNEMAMPPIVASAASDDVITQHELDTVV